MFIQRCLVAAGLPATFANLAGSRATFTVNQLRRVFSEHTNRPNSAVCFVDARYFRFQSFVTLAGKKVKGSTALAMRALFAAFGMRPPTLL